MSSEPFDIDLVIARLRAEVNHLREVGGAADYGAITELRAFTPPSAFALLARERGLPAKGTRQPAEVFFGVVSACRNFSGLRGEPAFRDVRATVGPIRDALIGWMPPIQGGRGCQWIQGDVLDYDANTILWSDVFQTQHFIGRAQ